MRAVAKLAAVLVWAVLLLPSVAFAQASLTGVVRDSSGAVLPGVTVEAASPVLIEKVRTAVRPLPHRAQGRRVRRPMQGRGGRFPDGRVACFNQMRRGGFCSYG